MVKASEVNKIEEPEKKEEISEKTEQKAEAAKSLGSVVFGKKYPPHMVNGVLNPNSVAFRDYLPDLFARSKHFSSKQYQDEVSKKFPKFKKKWYQKALSEKDIEKLMIKEHGFGAMDGANSVPQLEEKLGIKIGGGYKYPKGMTDIEYHAYTMEQIGLYSPYREPNPKTQEDAYICAWQEMHYPREKMLPILQQQYQELIELNPQLKDVKLDTNNPVHLTLFRAGVTYNFPVADINLFIAEHDIGNTAKRHSERMKKELTEAGVSPDITVGWVLSSETIKDIGRKLKEKEQVNETVKIEELVKKEETVAEVPSVQQTEVKAEVAKSPKDVVSEKLKAMGMEDGSYMLIDKNDDFYTLYSGANGPEGRSVKGYLESGKEEIAKTGKDAVYCSNNGIVGAYFKEGVYVLTTDYGLKNALYLRGEETSLGVMLSNGEYFVNKDGKVDFGAKLINQKWFGDKEKGVEGIRDKGTQVYNERVEAYNARQKWREELENASAADKVHHSLKSLVEFADKHDKSGQLKDSLVKSFMHEPEKMLTLEFWGNCAKDFADKSEVGKDAFIQEMGSFGLDIGKDIKANQNNSQYQAVKKRCAECETCDDMLKTAKSCAARSHCQAEQYFEAANKR